MHTAAPVFEADFYLWYCFGFSPRTVDCRRPAIRLYPNEKRARKTRFAIFDFWDLHSND
jgi:hypothetical protein